MTAKQALFIPPGSMTHEQKGQVLALSDALGAEQFAEALEWIGSVRTEKEAAEYIETLCTLLEVVHHLTN